MNDDSVAAYYCCDCEFMNHRPDCPCERVAAQNREAVISWPPEATATPPTFPFRMDRHTYTAESDAAWRERNLG